MYEIIILISVVTAGIAGIIITRNVFGSDQIHGKIKNRYKSYIADLEADNKKLNGKLNKMKQGVSISKDEFDEENPLGSIGALVQQISPMLPKSIRPFLSDPKLMQYAEKMIQENPEKLKEIISKFVTKGKKDETVDVITESV